MSATGEIACISGLGKYNICMKELINKIVCGDCIEVLGKAEKPFADLIFADPPFNIGYKYDKYKDKRKAEHYIEWTKQWMAACKKVLKSDGSFYIAIGDDYAANVKLIADELGLVLRNWIIWHYTFGQQTKNKFARSHTHIFYFVNDKKDFTFNDTAVRVPSERQLTYNDKRANPAGKMPDDVWTEYSRVCGTFKERESFHPCQMPEAVLKRIIAASSNPGDNVLDPFSGSGTTAAAAYKLKRNYTGIDISKEYVTQTGKRLKQIKKTTTTKTSFDVFELDQIKQLLIDMKTTAGKVLAEPKLMSLFCNQLENRLAGDGKIRTENITLALTEFIN